MWSIQHFALLFEIISLICGALPHEVHKTGNHKYSEDEEAVLEKSAERSFSFYEFMSQIMKWFTPESGSSKSENQPPGNSSFEQFSSHFLSVLYGLHKNYTSEQVDEIKIKFSENVEGKETSAAKTKYESLQETFQNVNNLSVNGSENDQHKNKKYQDKDGYDSKDVKPHSANVSVNDNEICYDEEVQKDVISLDNSSSVKVSNEDEYFKAEEEGYEGNFSSIEDWYQDEYFETEGEEYEGNSSSIEDWYEDEYFKAGGEEYDVKGHRSESVSEDDEVYDAEGYKNEDSSENKEVYDYKNMYDEDIYDIDKEDVGAEEKWSIEKDHRKKEEHHKDENCGKGETANGQTTLVHNGDECVKVRDVDNDTNFQKYDESDSEFRSRETESHSLVENLGSIQKDQSVVLVPIGDTSSVTNNEVPKIENSDSETHTNADSKPGITVEGDKENKNDKSVIGKSTMEIKRTTPEDSMSMELDESNKDLSENGKKTQTASTKAMFEQSREMQDGFNSKESKKKGTSTFYPSNNESKTDTTTIAKEVELNTDSTVEEKSPSETSFRSDEVFETKSHTASTQGTTIISSQTLRKKTPADNSLGRQYQEIIRDKIQAQINKLEQKNYMKDIEDKSNPQKTEAEDVKTVGVNERKTYMPKFTKKSEINSESLYSSAIKEKDRSKERESTSHHGEMVDTNPEVLTERKITTSSQSDVKSPANKDYQTDINAERQETTPNEMKVGTYELDQKNYAENIQYARSKITSGKQSFGDTSMRKSGSHENREKSKNMLNIMYSMARPDSFLGRMKEKEKMKGAHTQDQKKLYY